MKHLFFSALALIILISVRASSDRGVTGTPLKPKAGALPSPKVQATSPSQPTQLTDDDGDGYYAEMDDCDDSDPAINPGATEVCNGIDDDCDALVDDDDDPVTGQSTWYADNDNDGYGDASSTLAACVAPAGYVADNTDCDDYNAYINPDAPEVCNGVDDDCNGTTDDGLPLYTYYYDWDGDGYGVWWWTLSDCYGTPPPGYSLMDDDCDDSDLSVYPGAPEICNGLDDNCDGIPDDGLPPGDWYYADLDGDGYGNWWFGYNYFCGTPPPGWVLWSLPEDCDEFDASVNPGATEIYCNGIDDNCSGFGDDDDVVQFEDSDGDTYGNPAGAFLGCPLMPGYVLNSDDCDDTDTSGGTASAMYIDKDNDGFGETASVTSCPGGTCAGNYNATISFPAYADEATWTLYNGFGTPIAFGGPYGFGNTVNFSFSGAAGPYKFKISTTGYYCDNYGTFTVSAEGGYSATLNFGPCSVDSIMICTGYGVAATNDDCDDADAAVNPGATEVCNGIDDDCDGVVDNSYGMLVTQLNPESCGVTVLNYSHVLRANAMAGAVQYEFEFFDGTNTYYELRPNRGFYFLLFTWPMYNTTYTVRVRWYDGSNWSCWGPPCTVTTPSYPVTQLQSGDCGATATSPAHVFRAKSMPGATQYEFEFDDGVNTYYELRPNRGFYFSLFTWDQFSTTYTVKVRWYDGTTWSPWGPPCNVTTSPMPTTQLQPGDCGATVTSTAQVLRANSMAGADQYEFKLSDGTNTWYLLRPNRGTYLLLFGAGPWPAGSYTMEVRWRDAGTGMWSAWGSPCSLTLPAPLSDEAGAIIEGGFDVQAFPVPFADVVNLTVETFSAEPVHVTVTDVNGRVVEDRRVQMEHNGLLTLGERWSNGVYMIRVRQGNDLRTLRVVKTQP